MGMLEPGVVAVIAFAMRDKFGPTASRASASMFLQLLLGLMRPFFAVNSCDADWLAISGEFEAIFEAPEPLPEQCDASRVAIADRFIAMYRERREFFPPLLNDGFWPQGLPSFLRPIADDLWWRVALKQFQYYWPAGAPVEAWPIRGSFKKFSLFLIKQAELNVGE
eukprot:NODE_13796_length_1146_cov_7.567223.p1 GENE.NODE_13796_length_1146_cov_7.567223~~NODE_13796_length_1146_cov_7.567223.p1  ORF type:complete len:166 (+),score=16.08 NODE_13796_length_1146_cov_7.567223:635-1132(+)